VTPTTKQTGEATVREERRTGETISHGVLLAVCCLLSYKIITVLLTVSRFVPRDDELLGGMWAVVATIFVFRYSCEESIRAALSRTSATLLSFALCLVYLLVFPFRVWGLVVLVAVGAIVLDLIGRSEDMITASITTAVVLVHCFIGRRDRFLPFHPCLNRFPYHVGSGNSPPACYARNALTSLLLKSQCQRRYHKRIALSYYAT
jgi:hypothetical protein